MSAASEPTLTDATALFSAQKDAPKRFIGSSLSAPQWVHAITHALIDLISAWHDLTVSDFCGKSSDRCINLERLKKAEHTVSKLSSNFETRTDSATAADAFDEAQQLANKCSTALRDVGPTADASIQLQQITQKLRESLEGYKNTAELMVNEHSNIALATVVGVFEFAIWSVTATQESTAAAYAAMEHGRTYGRQTIQPASLNCADTAKQIQSRWLSLSSAIATFLDATAEIQDNDALHVLLDALKVSMTTIEFDSNRNNNPSGRVQYVMQQLQNMEKLLLEISNSERTATDAIEKASRLEIAAHQALESISQSLGELQARKAMQVHVDSPNEPAAENAIDMAEIVRQQTEKIKKEIEYDNIMQKRELARKDYENKQIATRVAAEKLNNVQRARDAIAMIAGLVEQIHSVRDQTEKWMTNCMRVNVAQVNIDSAINWHGGAKLCEIASLAAADFHAMKNAAMAEFDTRVENIVSRFNQRMDVYKRTAWRYMLNGKSSVTDGTQPLALMPALIAEQQLHVAAMRKAEAKAIASSKDAFGPIASASLHASASVPVDVSGPTTVRDLFDTERLERTARTSGGV